MANASQEYADADDNDKSNKGKQADNYEKNAEEFHVAAGDCQHSGLSLSAA